MEKKHHYFLDYLRVLGTCFVVFMHTASGTLHLNAAMPGKNWHLTNAATSLAFCAVPLFFMMSGYLLMNSRKTAQVSYLFKKRIPRLFVPLVVYSLLAALWLNFSAVEGLSLVGALKSFAAGASSPVMVHFWFMYTLIGMYLISPFLYRALSGLEGSGKRYLFWLIAVAMALSTLTMILPANVRVYLPFRFFSELLFFGNHICAFLLGWLLGNWERKIPNAALIAVALADWVLITVMTARLSVAQGAYTPTYQTQSQSFELLLAVCIFLLLKQNLNRPLGWVGRWAASLASLTFPIYLVHNILISVLGSLGFPALTAPQVLAMTLVVLLLAWLITKTLTSIKPLCFLFAGLPYEEACRTCNWVHTFRRKSTTDRG